MKGPEVVQVRSKSLGIGQRCALIAIGLYVAATAGLFGYIRELPGGRWLALVYTLLMLGFAVRAAHDALIWLFEAREALNQKRRFEAMGLNAAVEWARESEIRKAATLPLSEVDPHWYTVFQRTGQTPGIESDRNWKA